MSPKINWITDYDEAMKMAKERNKAVLLDFFNPE